MSKSLTESSGSLNPDVKPPTIKDLRVKTCYICQDEEHYDKPQDPPPVWTHPCKCSLVAHETCLLRWIEAAQNNKPNDSVKCPQCGFAYQWESDTPFVFRVLDAGNRLLDSAGTIVAIGTLGGLFSTALAGTYVTLTLYGAHAVKQFFGDEMFDLMLTYNFRRWPFFAFFHLPTIPISLLSSRSAVTASIMPVMPLLSTWMSFASSRIITSTWIGAIRDQSAPQTPTQLLWPPPPLLFGLFGAPLVSRVYRRYFARLTAWTLGVTPAPAVRGRQDQHNNDFVVQIGGMPLHFRVQERQRNQRRRNVEVANPANDNNNNDNAAEPAGENDAGAGEEHANARTVSFGSMGRSIGGALLTPTISSVMGSLLLYISKSSPVLRRLLAVKPPLTAAEKLAFNSRVPLVLTDDMNFGKQFTVILRALVGYSNGIWSRADPVWLRNSVGLGIYAVARDALHLLHVYLSKRELETRRVKDRDFRGIDPATLDLIHPEKFGPSDAATV